MRNAVRGAAGGAAEPSPAHPGRERGDVPGWVLVTLMTAGLVTVLWALASNRLQALFNNALNTVTGP